MTAMVDRPQMAPEEFEELARIVANTFEGMRVELINGKLKAKPVPDGDHGRIVQWLTRICIQARPELWVHDQGLKVETYRGGRARPDGVLAASDAFVGHAEWAPADAVLMVVEITSYDSDTDRRDRREKPRAYAETNIPVYLLIDRDTLEVKVYSEPDGSQYGESVVVPFGEQVTLPAPVAITLDTELLKEWVR
ncbi:Uma2 family endonuclease [Kitasatospora sp. LaBMicrA B282]|uniref:Uma2 family endonuclease n=1 Tax=Kitasatospora sp. LaBMicrA B282 TaxID=3420949 RepID=UPI003D096F28